MRYKTGKAIQKSCSKICADCLSLLFIMWFLIITLQISWFSLIFLCNRENSLKFVSAKSIKNKIFWYEFRYLTGFEWGLACSAEGRTIDFYFYGYLHGCMFAIPGNIKLSVVDQLPPWQKWCCSAILWQSWKRNTTLPTSVSVKITVCILMWGS